jgi:Fe2+ transport system protein FeoA
MRVRILNMDDLPVERRDHLLAFGLTPGEWVEIKQHRPAIVAQVDYTELALEPEDAERILVEMPTPVRGFRHFKRHSARRGRRARRGFIRHGRRKWRRRFLSRLFGIENDE